MNCLSFIGLLRGVQRTVTERSKVLEDLRGGGAGKGVMASPEEDANEDDGNSFQGYKFSLSLPRLSRRKFSAFNAMQANWSLVAQGCK